VLIKKFLKRFLSKRQTDGVRGIGEKKKRNTDLKSVDIGSEAEKVYSRKKTEFGWGQKDSRIIVKRLGE